MNTFNISPVAFLFLCVLALIGGACIACAFFVLATIFLAFRREEKQRRAREDAMEWDRFEHGALAEVDRIFREANEH